MAINPKIKQKVEDIRSKIFGAEVRESLASGIEAISEDVEATIDRQDYVEEQFQNVIDETSGKDVISAPELIAARNGMSNLKTRLDEEHAQVTAQLAQTEIKTLRQNQQDFYSFQGRNSTNVFENSYSILGDRHFQFRLGLSDNEYIEHTFKKNPLDDFLKWTESIFHINTGKPSVLKENFTSDMVSGGTMAGSAQNYYTTTQGTKVTYLFNGTSVSVFHRFDDRGGVWECFIDGEKVKEISTHSGAIPPSDVFMSELAKRTIASGLEQSNHTLELVFKGDDPNNPPSGGTGTSRGWLRKNENSAGDPNANQETFEVVSIGLMGEVPVIYNSNKEFAFRVKENGQTHSSEWVPEHNNIGTVFVGNDGIQELYIDGMPVSATSTTTDSPFKEAKIIQILEFKNPNESSRLGRLFLTTTINHKGVSFTSKVIWEKDTEISAGYVNMLTLDRTFARKIISSMGGIYPLEAVNNTNTEINEKAPYSFIALNDEIPNHYVYVQSFLPYETLRLNKEGRRGNADGSSLYWLQHRNERLQKLYPHTYSNHIARSGEIYRFEGHYGFGKHPRVAELFS